jgi:hypothetical protein
MEIYGQLIGHSGYDVIDSVIFAYWMPAVKVVGRVVQHPFAGGYKVHVSVDLADADRVARSVLPILQQMKFSHKVVYPLSAYASMNGGDQKGKFITIYVGPFMYSFLALVNRLDPVLVEMEAVPGPQAMDRLAEHLQPEQRIGLSGLLTYVTVADYRS